MHLLSRLRDEQQSVKLQILDIMLAHKQPQRMGIAAQAKLPLA
jgi:hypothetical protein